MLKKKKNRTSFIIDLDIALKRNCQFQFGQVLHTLQQLAVAAAHVLLVLCERSCSFKKILITFTKIYQVKVIVMCEFI